MIILRLDGILVMELGDRLLELSCGSTWGLTVNQRVDIIPQHLAPTFDLGKV